ncbi:MAG: hypothetical protein QM758_13415 [Armatimonas sp.]
MRKEAMKRFTVSELRDPIYRAMVSHAREVVIPPGIYRGGPARAEEAILAIREAENLRVMARGATMVCTTRTRALEFYRCRNVELVGLTIEYDPADLHPGDSGRSSPGQKLDRCAS